LEFSADWAKNNPHHGQIATSGGIRFHFDTSAPKRSFFVTAGISSHVSSSSSRIPQAFGRVEIQNQAVT
jgi:hypothetical protein